MLKIVVAPFALLLGSSLLSAQGPANPTAAAPGSHTMLTGEEIDLKWGAGPPSLPSGARYVVVEGDPSAPGVLFAYRLKMPDNYRIPAHFHPVDEHLTVISGTFNMGLGDNFEATATKAMGAGSYVIMPAGTRHFVWAKGETIIQVHAIGPWGITYVNPADDPRRR
jgi:quercetin dioxygenase-like cupin family protein